MDPQLPDHNVKEYLTSLYPVSYYLGHKIPKNLSKVSKFSFLDVSSDESTIQDLRSLSCDNNNQPVLLKSNIHIPSSTSIFYYEVDVIYAGNLNGTISIGLCSANSSINKWLGTENDSFGYRNCGINSDCIFLSQNQFHQKVVDTSPTVARSLSATNLSSISGLTSLDDIPVQYRSCSISTDYIESQMQPNQTPTISHSHHHMVPRVRLFRNRNSDQAVSNKLGTVNETLINQTIPQYSTGDVVGCGLNLVDKSVFFTRNGIILGCITLSVKTDTSPVLYPALCLGGGNAKVSINFGQKPYYFNIHQYISRQRAFLQNSVIDQKCSQILSHLTAKKFVLSYLLHEGHHSVAKALYPKLAEDEKKNHLFSQVNQSDVNMKVTEDTTLLSPVSDLTPLSAPIAFYDEPKWPTIKPPANCQKSLSFREKENYDNNKTESTLSQELNKQKPFKWPEKLAQIKIRKNISQHITNGQFLSALSLLNTHYPDVLKRIPSIVFVLQCRHFISLLVNHKDTNLDPEVIGNGVKEDADLNKDGLDCRNNGHTNGKHPSLNGNTSNDPIVSSSEEDVSPMSDYYPEEAEEKFKQMISNNIEDANVECLPNTTEGTNGHEKNRPKTLKRFSPTIRKFRPNGFLSNGNNTNGNVHSNGDTNHGGSLNGYHEKMKNSFEDKVRDEVLFNFNKIIDYGRELMSMANTLYEMKHINHTQVDLLKWTYSMLAYSDIHNSPFAPLLHQKHLDKLADSINSLLLETHNLSPEPEIKLVIDSLEKMTCPAFNKSALLNSSYDNYNLVAKSSDNNARMKQHSNNYTFSTNYLNFPRTGLKNPTDPAEAYPDFFHDRELNIENQLSQFSLNQNHGTNEAEKLFLPNLFLIAGQSSSSLAPMKETDFYNDFSCSGSELAGIFHPLLYETF